MDNKILFYDGACGFCHRTVQICNKWLSETSEVYFAELQGESAKELKAKFPEFPRDLQSIVYYDGEHIYLAEKGFFQLTRHFKSPWRLAYYLKYVPNFISSTIYKLVADNRYTLFFRKANSCTLPLPNERKRFIS